VLKNKSSTTCSIEGKRAVVFTQIGSDTTAALGEARVVTGGAEWRRPTAVFVGLFSLCWLLLYVVHTALPMIQSGAVAIIQAKFDRLVKQQMFAPDDRTRIMIFGNSKVVTGFYPSEFDPVFGPGMRSFNLGLPAEERFVPILEAALAAGNVPTHVLVTFPWDARTAPPPQLAILHDDNALINAVLPFRTLPRDLVLFAYNNRFRFAEGIRYEASQLDLMVENRGWYFIKWQSHFLNDQLPDDFTIPTDHPNQSDVRQFPARSLARDRLMQLATQYGFQILLVPSYHRTGEFAPAPSADADRDTVISTSPLVRLIGPDYWTYPTHYFADPVHLNPSGRSIYTADLAALLQKHRAF
jgi:hypothetical protein